MDKLFLAWQDLMSEQMSHSCKAICELIKATAKEKSRIGELDQAIFECLLKLKEIYLNILEAAASSETLGLLSGILDVLNSRVKQIEEISPISLEKQNIIDNIKINEPTYAIYKQTLQDLLQDIDDLHKRRILSDCFDLLRNEHEILCFITDSDVELLEPLKTARNMAEGVITDFEKTMQSENADIDYMSDDEFTEFIQKTFTYEHEFFSIIKNEIAAIYEKQKNEYRSNLYALQRGFSDDVHLASDAIKIFRTAEEELKNIDFDTKEDSTKFAFSIIQGITETIEIKVDSLSDGLSSYGIESGELVKSFAKEFAITQELSTIQEMAITSWLDTPPDEENIQEYFASFQLSTKNRSNEYFEKMTKIRTRFKSTVILYEILTYEEILNHSVSHLRASEIETVKKAVLILDDTFNNLGILIGKSNIFFVRPKPHDMFNAREHEVIVAEPHEGFSKGEIVKLLASGYKQAETVLIRAHVIAAK